MENKIIQLQSTLQSHEKSYQSKITSLQQEITDLKDTKAIDNYVMNNNDDDDGVILSPASSPITLGSRSLLDQKKKVKKRLTRYQKRKVLCEVFI